MLKAPWTPEQVRSLNDFQAAGVFHPFTCGTEGCRQSLVATEGGWVCPGGCGYTQGWCHASMADDSWRRADPFGEGR